MDVTTVTIGNHWLLKFQFVCIKVLAVVHPWSLIATYLLLDSYTDIPSSIYKIGLIVYLT